MDITSWLFQLLFFNLLWYDMDKKKTTVHKLLEVCNHLGGEQND